VRYSKRRDVGFVTQTDTEVLLHLYAQKGEAMVHDLRGMFAFGLWDAEKSALLLARDPYGIKPLYYADDGWTLRFASQVKALLAAGKISRPLRISGHQVLATCAFRSFRADGVRRSITQVGISLGPGANISC
jgi:asparagine synthetase B (glutamine-hydrolysing)